MQKTLPLWLTLFVLSSAGALAGTRADAEHELLAADRARAEAMVAADATALNRLLADDLTYGHSGGQVQNKRELVDEIRSGARKYRTLTSEDAVARAYGCAGVVTGKASAEVELNGHPASLTLRYTATYVRAGGRWVMVAYQSVKLPDAAPHS